MTQSHDKSPATSDEGWTIPVDNGKPGLGRRTVVAGAAWSLPVIALAVATPLAAASTGTPTLTFVNGPYAVDACGTLGSVILQRTTDGTTPAPAGEIVVVTLPDGVTWSDGTNTPRSLPTDANGQVILTGLLAPASNDTYEISASSGAAAAVAPVVVTGAEYGLYINEQLVEPDAISVTEGVNGYVFVKADGSVWQRTSGSSSAVQIAPAGTNPTDIMASTWNPNGANVGYYIANGNLYYGGGTIAESGGVVSVHEGSNGYVFVKADGSVWERTSGSTAAVRIAPAGTNPSDIGASTWGAGGLNQAVYVSNGTIYYANHNLSAPRPAESGVVTLTEGPNGYVFVKTDGSVWARANGSTAAVMVAPAGTNPSSVVAATWTRDSRNIAVFLVDGTVYYADGTSTWTAESGVVGIAEGINGYVFVKADGSVWERTSGSGVATQLAPAGTNPSAYIASTWNRDGANHAYYLSGTAC